MLSTDREQESFELRRPVDKFIYSSVDLPGGLTTGSPNSNLYCGTLEHLHRNLSTHTHAIGRLERKRPMVRGGLEHMDIVKATFVAKQQRIFSFIPCRPRRSVLR